MCLICQLTSEDRKLYIINISKPDCYYKLNRADQVSPVIDAQNLAKQTERPPVQQDQNVLSYAYSKPRVRYSVLDKGSVLNGTHNKLNPCNPSSVPDIKALY